jgi:hypothetical protein
MKEARIKRRSLASSWAPFVSGFLEPLVVTGRRDLEELAHRLHAELLAVRLK